jgi:excisionase family DNA binding protein
VSRSRYQPPDGYLTMTQAQERLGVSKLTFIRLVRRAGLPTHRDHRDTRVRLVKITDVDRLLEPVPEQAEQGWARSRA